jgi:Tol biopolymer transport system component
MVSPDSRNIAFTPSSSPGASADNGEVWIVGADGTRERRLADKRTTTDVNSTPGRVGWRSADEVLFARDGSPELFVKNIRTGLETTLPQSPEIVRIQPGATARSTRLPFVHVAATGEVFYSVPFYLDTARDQQASLMSRKLADGSERIVVRPCGCFWRPSLDGSQLAYWTTDFEAPANARFRLNVGAVGHYSHRVLLLASARVDILAWSPDNRRLLYMDDAPRILEVATGASRPLLDRPIQDLISTSAPGPFNSADWAPDGSFIVFSLRTQPMHRFAWEGVTYDAVKKLVAAGERR